MALTRDSVLHYWDARNGVMATVGGRPHHTRSSAGKWIDTQGQLQSAIVNTPRFELATMAGERRALMLLERAGANLVDADFGSWTLSGGATRASGQPDPAGGLNAYKLTASASGSVQRTTPFTGNATKVALIALRNIDAQSTVFGIFDSTAPAWRGQGIITWTGLVPTGFSESGGGGGLVFPIGPLIDGWYLFGVTCPGVVAANTNVWVVDPEAGAGTHSVLAYFPQAENAITVSSLMTIAGTRAADSFYWDFTWAPQAMAIYSRHREGGSALDVTSNPRVWQFGKSDNTDARLAIYHETHYKLYHSAAASVTKELAASPAVGDDVRLLALVFADGSIQLIQSINGAAVTATTVSGANAFAAAWSDQRLWLNSIGATGLGLNRFGELKVVKYADLVGATSQARMDEMTAFELMPNGEVVS